jgi:hypothetical protein
MYLRGYLQGSENGRVVTIGSPQAILVSDWSISKNLLL